MQHVQQILTLPAINVLSALVCCYAQIVFQPILLLHQRPVFLTHVMQPAPRVLLTQTLHNVRIALVVIILMGRARIDVKK